MNSRINESNSTVDNRPRLTVELAVFFDAAAYRTFHPLVSRDEAKLLDLVLAYINNVQAIFYHPSLGQPIHLALVRVDLMEHQPEELADLDGYTDVMVPAVCKYALKQNPPNDNDPKHWDLALYITGLDLYDKIYGKNILGIAELGGVCWETHECAIAEFGVADMINPEIPTISTGFLSTYIAAHEIGHSLGMHHDGENDSSHCPQNGYIMSSNKELTNETFWSICSRQLVETLPSKKTCLFDSPTLNYKFDHRRRFIERPGAQWSAKKQCEIYLRNTQAYVINETDICNDLQCVLPQDTKVYNAGPPLDGTKCGENFECYVGFCSNVFMIQRRNSEFLAIQRPPTSGWSDWTARDCMSNCIQDSFGYIQRVRSCLDKSKCQGFEVQGELCNDIQLCEQKSRNRLKISDVANNYCRRLSTGLGLTEIDDIDGYISKYDKNIPQSGCTYICKRKSASSYIEPVRELQNYRSNRILMAIIKENAIVPDGTWCHKDAQNINYYCMRGLCKPNNQRLIRNYNHNRRQRLLGPISTWPSRNSKIDKCTACGCYIRLPEMIEKGSPVF